MDKKGQVFQNLAALGVGIAGLTITLVITFLIISQGRTQIEGIEGTQSNSSAYNSTVTLANAVDDIPGWVPLIVIAAIGAILLSMVSLFRR